MSETGLKIYIFRLRAVAAVSLIRPQQFLLFVMMNFVDLVIYLLLILQGGWATFRQTLAAILLLLP
jgi:hypothetical protein